MIEQIKERIAELEKGIQNLVTNHTMWTAQLAEAKHMLDMATKAAEVIAPTSCVTEVLEGVDKVVDEASVIVDNI